MSELKPNYDTNRKRLADIIPLAYPFTIYIEQTKYCNFKCYYCMHSSHDKTDGVFARNGHHMVHMEEALYHKIIAQLGDLGIRRIVFSGLGEPLMNPRFSAYVKYAVDAGIAERVEVLTNGALITPEYADALIAAGITNINISIQGLDSAAYAKVCGAKINFERFIASLTYLFEHREHAKIYIKCIDAILKSPEEKQRFYDLFGGISDRIYIEHLVVMQQSMENLHEMVDDTRNLYGEIFSKKREVCAQCFYFLQAGVDGEIYPCSIPGVKKDFSIGNLAENTLSEIWNGALRRQHLLKMLEFKRAEIDQCRNCSCFNCINDPMEYLDADAPRLAEYFR